MTIQATTTYTTTDGREFPSMDEAERHEAVLTQRPLIENFIGAVMPENNSRYKKATARLLLEWEEYKMARAVEAMQARNEPADAGAPA